MNPAARSSVARPAGALRVPVPYDLRAGRAVEFLLARGTLPVLYWLKKDILAVPVERESRNLEKFAERIRIQESQNPDGSWSKKKRAAPAPSELENCLFETIRSVFKLYDFGCEGDEEAIRKAVGFVFSTQKLDGVFQGPDWPEQSPITHALALELLCRLGQGADKRVQKGFRWLIRKQQEDGGWSAPGANANVQDCKRRGKGLSQSSFRVTGVVLRAMAESPHWQRSRETRRAGEFLLSRFYPDKAGGKTRGSSCWEELTYPFWATNLLSGLDVLSRIGFKPDKGRIPQALDWLMRRQLVAGYWESKPEKPSLEDHLWVTLSVLRILKTFEVINR
jgi:prenyltransferase beta subunit